MNATRFSGYIYVRDVLIAKKITLTIKKMKSKDATFMIKRPQKSVTPKPTFSFFHVNAPFYDYNFN